MGNKRTSATGKVVVVTGGARGIGGAVAETLSAAGALVAIGDVDTTLAETTAARVGGIGLGMDVRSRESFAVLLDQTEARLGPVDVLVNNAGIMVIGAMLDTPLEHQLRQLDVNLRGVVIGCHEAASRMTERGSGLIVNMASMAGRIPTPGSAVYSATKAGVLALSDALDAEWAERGVRVACVLPSFTKTSLIDGTTPPKSSPAIEARQVGEAVLSMVQRYRPVVTVPASIAPAIAQWGLMPQGVRRLISRRTGIDTMFLDYDRSARESYQQRTTSDRWSR